MEMLRALIHADANTYCPMTSALGKADTHGYQWNALP
jgi:hypothetical protein